MRNSIKSGFTLVELLVVIAIIAILSSVVLASLGAAKQKGLYARTQTDINQLRNAMILYRLDKGELPPLGDNCSACSNPPNSTWTTVIDALVSGNYIADRIDKDPWGNYYGYDDNDCNSGTTGTSYLFTSGADRVSWTTDDYLVTLTKSCGN